MLVEGTLVIDPRLRWCFFLPPLQSHLEERWPNNQPTNPAALKHLGVGIAGWQEDSVPARRSKSRGEG
jgi:hypothetical protein